jgi:hypothetical protein
LCLEHIIRAAATVADDRDIVVVGSQAILGQHPDAPRTLLVSRDADVFPRNHPERADLIEGALGEESYFDETYGYYAHAVGPPSLPVSSRVREAVRRGLVARVELLKQG